METRFPAPRIGRSLFGLEFGMQLGGRGAKTPDYALRTAGFAGLAGFPAVVDQHRVEV